MSEVIQGEGFTVKLNKFNFFFGQIASTPDNQRRSVDNLNGFRQLGIEEENNGRERVFRHLKVLIDCFKSPCDRTLGKVLFESVSIWGTVGGIGGGGGSQRCFMNFVEMTNWQKIIV